MSGRILIAEMAKNRRERLRVAIDTYKGHEVVDIRAFVEGPDGTPRPTRIGLTLRTALLPELVAALGKAVDAIAGHNHDEGANDAEEC